MKDRRPTVMRPVQTADLTREEAYWWSLFQDDEMEGLIARALAPDKTAEEIGARINLDGSIKGGAEGRYCVVEDYRELRRSVKGLGEWIAKWERVDPPFDLAELPASQLRDDLALEMEP